MLSLHPYRASDLLISDQLRHAPPFASLPTDPGDCLALLREGALFAVPADIQIVAPGDLPALLVVTEGRLCEPDNGRNWPAGSWLGIAETLADAPFTSVVRTAAPTILYRLDAGLLLALLNLCPAVARCLLADAPSVAGARSTAPAAVRASGASA